jgi:hypothetical protein
MDGRDRRPRRSRREESTHGESGYQTGEEGEIRVVKAGPNFELIAVNQMGDVCMSTPAIADGMIFVRTQQFLYGIGRRQVSQGRKDR